MLNPYQLQVFLTAAETLNFSRAAEKLGLSQPSITQHIHQLESQLGVSLFIRKGRKMALSEAGMALMPLARQILLVNSRAEELMQSLRGEVIGHLTIGCSTTPGKYLLPLILARFMTQHPRVQATVHVTPRALALEMLRKGDVDFAFSSSFDEFDRHIEFRPFYREPVVLIVPLDHPWAAQGEISPQDLTRECFVMREESAGTFRVVRNALAKHGLHVHDLRIVLTLGNSEAIVIAVQRGIGAGFVPQSAVEQVGKGKVATVRVRDMALIEEIFFCRYRLHPLGSAQEAFWNFLAQVTPEDLATQPDERGLCDERSAAQQEAGIYAQPNPEKQ
ncbi:LysR family transcriptional regulator [Thermanaerothrix sp.]|uniref:LysR family transcriptional regulator n=1 Tax=Thermanaerothrix sp. TaxID=2972675 RepID=UPI002ADE48B7|nr:LysR family transcriptional regulator [Thermanaerothrix sp.]